MKNQPTDTVSISMTRVEDEILAEILLTAAYLAEENKFAGIDFEDILHFQMYLDTSMNQQ